MKTENKLHSKIIVILMLILTHGGAAFIGWAVGVEQTKQIFAELLK